MSNTSETAQTTQLAWGLRATLALDPVALAKVPLPDGQAVVSVKAYAAGRLVTAELNVVDLKRVLAAVARAWPLEQATDVVGDLSAGKHPEGHPFVHLDRAYWPDQAASSAAVPCPCPRRKAAATEPA